MNNEFEVSGAKYRAGRLNAFQQFHVVRRLGAIAGALGAVVASVKGGASVDADDALSLVDPVLRIIGQMSDADTDYVLRVCLGVVQRQNTGGAWSQVMTGSQLLFEDIDLPSMMQIVWRVLEPYVAGFISAAPQTSGEAAAKTG